MFRKTAARRHFEQRLRAKRRNAILDRITPAKGFAIGASTSFTAFLALAYVAGAL